MIIGMIIIIIISSLSSVSLPIAIAIVSSNGIIRGGNRGEKGRKQFNGWLSKMYFYFILFTESVCKGSLWLFWDTSPRFADRNPKTSQQALFFTPKKHYFLGLFLPGFGFADYGGNPPLRIFLAEKMLRI